MANHGRNGARWFGAVGRVLSFVGLAAAVVGPAIIVAAPVADAGSPTISGVSFYGSYSDPFVVVTGSGFGTEPTPGPAGNGYSGNDFGATGLNLADKAAPAWTAGENAKSTGGTWNWIGLNVSLYTDSEIVFSLGNAYDDDYISDDNYLHQGDSFTVTVGGQTFSGTVPPYTAAPLPSVSATYSCSLTTGTGPSLSVTAEVFDTSPPPSTMDVGASYSTSYGLIADLPAGFISDIQDEGATELVLGGSSLAVTTSGSGAMNPSTNSAEATNTPIDLDLGSTANAAADTIIGGTFATVTWTAQSAGTVDFLPGTVDLAFSAVTSSGGMPATYSCNPSPANTIDSTTVDPASSTASYQASAVTIDSEVTAGSDAGWDLQVSNVSTRRGDRALGRHLRRRRWRAARVRLLHHGQGPHQLQVGRFG